MQVNCFHIKCVIEIRLFMKYLCTMQMIGSFQLEHTLLFLVADYSLDRWYRDGTPWHCSDGSNRY